MRRRHGVLSSNVDYAQDEFLRRACKQLGVPFIVLLKEHVNTIYGEQAWVAGYTRTGYRCEGDALAVFGPPTRDLLVAHGVCAAERTAVTGPLRFDARSNQREQTRCDTVVLCAFSRPEQEGAAAFPPVHAAFLAPASLRPEPRFVVKCRDQYEVHLVVAMLPKPAEGVVVTHEVAMSGVLSSAVLVIEFGSLALVEALYSPAEVVAVRFAGCSDDDDVQFDERESDVAEVVRFAHTPEEMRQMVLDVASVDQHPQRAARLALLHRLFSAPEPSYSAALDTALEAWLAPAVAEAGAG